MSEREQLFRKTDQLPFFFLTQDRVRRLGQKRETTVFRLVMEDSVEQMVLDIQAEKRKLMMAAFREKNNKRMERQSRNLGDIQRLLR